MRLTKQGSHNFCVFASCELGALIPHRPLPPTLSDTAFRRILMSTLLRAGVPGAAAARAPHAASPHGVAAGVLRLAGVPMPTVGGSR